MRGRNVAASPSDVQTETLANSEKNCGISCHHLLPFDRLAFQLPGAITFNGVVNRTVHFFRAAGQRLTGTCAGSPPMIVL